MREEEGRLTEQGGGLRKQLARMIRGRASERERERGDGERRRRWKKGRCKRLMRESEKLILTSLWAGRLRKIREIE